MAKTSGSLRKRFGKRLREWRVHRGLTQEELANRAGVDSKYLGTVERGQASIAIDRMGRLADALAVDPAALLQPDAAGKDATSDNFVRLAGDVFRKARSGQRRVVMQVLRDVASLYGNSG